ncbi:hypothetical protein O7599_13960 [Streptomyces sp. WMMC500]|uniref:hypothetical protein n=1 Tax=Streptomyces sp. WMMC500 TaxID=3015154 RepID=UPI00248BCBAC|nr:hypothetical protein [Streptomyces sp. WMMC500]WBB63556.1 hypothetical protein O7599_13960 [Streptomyces sp. WMMC500]
MGALLRIRVLSGLTALAATVGLVLLPTGGGANAADATESAVTVEAPEGGRFEGLEVTVHQTKQLRTQGVRLTWEGGKPTTGITAGTHNYLQIMQCWGDEDTGPAGPDREQCEFGANPSQPTGFPAGQRQVGFESGSRSHDPAESEYPATSGRLGFVPFRPADGSPATTSHDDPTYYNQNTTTAQPFNLTGQNGTGEAVYEVKSAIDATWLDCGGTVAAGQQRPCWLVIVPRGDVQVNGEPGANNDLESSPLSTTNWNERMAVKLDFLPTEDTCPTGRDERDTRGTEMVEDAARSWNRSLCATSGVTYSYNKATDIVARDTAQNYSSGGTLGFASDPAEQVAGDKPLVHAPVALSGLTVGFFIEDKNGAPVKQLRLNARLIAKLLTSSYQVDVPDGAESDNGVPRQPHVADNPRSLVDDPEFKKLNPSLADKFTHYQHHPQGLMVSIDNADVYRLVWQWLQSDKDARAFLSGTPDQWGMKVNRYYKALNLDSGTPLDTFPKADESKGIPKVCQSECVTLEARFDINNLRPYTNGLSNTAERVRQVRPGQMTTWDPQKNPQGLKEDPTQQPGRRFQLGLTDTASAEQYGLQTAQLPDADGTWVSPTEAALLKGAAAMKPDKAGVYGLDPADADDGAYPLTALTHAIASTGLEKKARTEYAEYIRYAVGRGQTPGLSNGQLPHGYAPLPDKLRDQARDAADALEAGAPGDGGPGGNNGEGGSPNGGQGGPGTGSPGGTGTSGLDGGAGGAAAGGGGDADGGSGSGGGENDPANTEDDLADQGNVAQTGPSTPETLLGVIRWVLLAVLILAAASALAGPALMRIAALRAARASDAAGSAKSAS